ncbi:MAG: HD domain-containing protein [Oscillospiraceae bacterium]|nr:HD domain-containing protein [Oscillospiraceae bacterium]
MTTTYFDRRQSQSKTFRDNVHGYISIPMEYVRLFIDTELFQRLRQIEQTGMRALYPGARHDRFIHSLGVLHLAGMAFERFWRNSKADVPGIENEVGGEHVWKYCGVLFEVAALLHDCGHAPFSHTLEFLYDYGTDSSGNPAMNGAALNKRLLALNKSPDFQADFKSNDSKGTPHERMSALLVCSEYREAVGKLLNMLESPPDLDDALEFITRMIIGCRYRQNLTHEKSLRNCFITLLNSSSIDVDKLDYIMRDADMSGLNTIAIDIDRLLDSLTLTPITTLTGVSFKEYPMNNTVIAGTLRPLSAGSGDKARLENCEIDGELEVNVADSGEHFDKYQANVKGTLTVAGSRDKDKGGSRFSKGRKPLKKEEEDFDWDNYELKEYQQWTGSCFALYQPSSVNFKALKADKIGFSYTYVQGGVTGLFTGSLAGDFRENLNASPNVSASSAPPEVYYEVGYRKSSLNVIESVAYARNYEYQWVHAHHKVKYYGDYLLYALLRGSVKLLLGKFGKPNSEADVTAEICEILSYRTMEGFQPYTAQWGDTYWRPTDADILSLFSKCHVLLKKDKEDADKSKQELPPESKDLLRLLDEYAGRNYRKSLWKSYAEMCVYLTGFTRNQIESVWRAFCEESKIGESIHEKTSGLVDAAYADKFQRCRMRDVVWVNGKANLKELNQNETYIYFPDENPKRKRIMTFASVSRSIGSKPESVEYANLLYLYYRPTFDKDGNEEKVDKVELTKLLYEIAGSSKTAGPA